MGRRLLDQLQERVPGGVRELVRLVEDVDLVPPLDGAQFRAFARMRAMDVFPGPRGPAKR
jgi:hypothetical protein